MQDRQPATVLLITLKKQSILSGQPICQDNIFSVSTVNLLRRNAKKKKKEKSMELYSFFIQVTFLAFNEETDAAHIQVRLIC